MTAKSRHSWPLSLAFLEIMATQASGPQQRLAMGYAPTSLVSPRSDCRLKKQHTFKLARSWASWPSHLLQISRSLHCYHSAKADPLPSSKCVHNLELLLTVCLYQQTNVMVNVTLDANTMPQFWFFITNQTALQSSLPSLGGNSLSTGVGGFE